MHRDINKPCGPDYFVIFTPFLKVLERLNFLLRCDFRSLIFSVSWSVWYFLSDILGERGKYFLDWPKSPGMDPNPSTQPSPRPPRIWLRQLGHYQICPVFRSRGPTSTLPNGESRGLYPPPSAPSTWFMDAPYLLYSLNEFGALNRISPNVCLCMHVLRARGGDSLKIICRNCTADTVFIRYFYPLYLV